MNALEVNGLCVCHQEGDTQKKLVDNFSFFVKKGEISGIVGESGSGKSTAMLAVMGLLGKGAVKTAGDVRVCGMEPEPGKNIAMIFQDSQNCLNPSLRIGRQITETIRMRRKCGRREAYDRAVELLEQTGIRSPELRMKQYPFELSGGMRQRVVTAIALACEPKVIIADEPTTALDAAVQSQILTLLGRMAKETGTALLLVSHDMGVIASLCRQIYVIKDGALLESGSAEEIFYNPREDDTKRLIREASSTRQYLPAEGAGDVCLQTDHVTCLFDTKEGVQDLSLCLRKGEIFALAGESGSGKTTLARLATGLLAPDKGSILKTGGIQMVFQDPYASLNPCLTAGQTLGEALAGKYGAKRNSQDRENRQKEQREMLELVGLKPSDEGKYPWELSGGERQRLGIARALIMEPEILVCDEAFSALDGPLQTQMLVLLRKLQEEREFACLFISHDIRMIRRISSRMGVMYMGRLVETGTTKDVCTDPWHPYTKRLVESVPEPDPVRAGRRHAGPVKEGRPPASGGCPYTGRCGYEMAVCREAVPGEEVFGGRMVRCFLYGEAHSKKRSGSGRMTSQI